MKSNVTLGVVVGCGAIWSLTAVSIAGYLSSQLSEFQVNLLILLIPIAFVVSKRLDGPVPPHAKATLANQKG